MDLKQGFLLGKYRIIEKIGAGGMADVYLAVDTSLDRVVALKLLPPEFASDKERVVRFNKEVRASAQLTHPNIITVYDVVQKDDYYFYTMDYISGGDLKERIAQGLSQDEAVKVLYEIGSALSHAHKHRFVHRDLKPDNIMFQPDGTAVLTDFGIAKVVGSGTRVTKVGTCIGTPHYMSPEQARGMDLDHRSDLYSLGILFYEMLTGTLPYDDKDTFKVALKHINDPIPQFPPEFQKFQPMLDSLLAKNPKGRYANAERLLLEINRYRKKGGGTPPTSFLRRVQITLKKIVRSNFKWAMGGGLLALLFGGVVYLLVLQ